MSAFKDSGHFWWQQCQRCRQAWFVGSKPDDVDEDVTCPRCDAEDLRAASAREEGRREGFEKAITALEGHRDGANAIGLMGRGQVFSDAISVIRAMRDGASICRCGKARDEHDANGLRVTVGQVPVCSGFAMRGGAHSCKNCEGIGPESCLFNPERA